MNDKELIAEIQNARSESILPDQKIDVIFEVNGQAYCADMVTLMPPAQSKQLYGLVGHKIIIYLEELPL